MGAYRVRLRLYINILTSVLDSLTFFAPNNNAIPDHKHKKDVASIQVSDADALSSLAAHLNALKDDDDDKKKEIFKKILHAVLLYHILPYDVTTIKLGENSTGKYISLLQPSGHFSFVSFLVSPHCIAGGRRLVRQPIPPYSP